MSTLEHKPRKFRCRSCKRVQSITTNHETECLDYCKNCSWKAGWGGPNLLGCWYRVFEFAGRKDATVASKEKPSGP